MTFVLILNDIIKIQFERSVRKKFVIGMRSGLSIFLLLRKLKKSLFPNEIDLSNIFFSYEPDSLFQR